MVDLNSLGNRGWKLRAVAKGDAKDMRHRYRHRVQRKLRVPLRRHSNVLYQFHGLVEREPSAFGVVRELWETLSHEFHPAAVEERPITRHRHQHRPTGMI